MANKIVYLPHSIQVVNGSTTWIDQIDGTNQNEGISTFEEITGSNTDLEYTAIRGVDPIWTLTTSNLAILSSIGINGLFIDSTNSGNSLTIYGRALANGGLPVAIGSSAHMSWVMSDGLIVPDAIRAGHNTLAKIGISAYPILGTGGSSGATPVVISSAQTIPSGAGSTVKTYVSGPVKFTISGGSSYLVQGIIDSAVTFGIQVLREGTDGDVNPSIASILARVMKMEFTTRDETLAAVVNDGQSFSSAAMFFRKVNSNGTRVPVGTSAHVSITGTAGMITPGATALTHRQPGVSAFTITPVFNTQLATISTTATIPTS